MPAELNHAVDAPEDTVFLLVLFRAGVTGGAGVPWPASNVRRWPYAWSAGSGTASPPAGV